MASPSALRMALGLALPSAVDEAYAVARREAGGLAPDLRLTYIATRFAQVVFDIEQSVDFFGQPGVPDVRWVTGDKLYRWLAAAGKALDTKAIVTTGLSHEQLVRAVALDTRDRYAALVAATRELELIVDRLDILAQAADPNRRSRLQANRHASQQANAAPQ